MASAPHRVLLVDDSALVRQNVRSMLESCSELSVIGEAESGIEAVSMTSYIRPDVIVMDIKYAGNEWHRSHETHQSSTAGDPRDWLLGQ